MHSSWKKGKLEDVKRPLVITVRRGAGARPADPAGRLRRVPRHDRGRPDGRHLGHPLVAVRAVAAAARSKQSLSRGVVGMTIAHIGVGVFAIGVTVTQTYRIEKDIALQAGPDRRVAGLHVRVPQHARRCQGPNYDAIEAEIVVTRDGKPVTTLHPQKRTYRVQTMPMTESGIHVNWNARPVRRHGRRPRRGRVEHAPAVQADGPLHLARRR